MKISKTIFILTLWFIACVPSAIALKRAPFPDSSSLQPMPEDVQPNISGNVNSSVMVEQSSDFEYDLPKTETDNDFSTSLSQENSSQNEGNSYGVYAVVIIIVLAGIFAWRRLKDEK